MCCRRRQNDHGGRSWFEIGFGVFNNVRSAIPTRVHVSFHQNTFIDSYPSDNILLWSVRRSWTIPRTRDGRNTKTEKTEISFEDIRWPSTTLGIFVYCSRSLTRVGGMKQTSLPFLKTWFSILSVMFSNRINVCVCLKIVYTLILHSKRYRRLNPIYGRNVYELYGHKKRLFRNTHVCGTDILFSH